MIIQTKNIPIFLRNYCSSKDTFRIVNFVLIRFFLNRLQTCDKIEQKDYFIQIENSDSSRYYAAYLWNFKLICEADENEVSTFILCCFDDNFFFVFKCINEYFRKCVACTILKMSSQDLITMRKLIMV